MKKASILILVISVAFNACKTPKKVGAVVTPEPPKAEVKVEKPLEYQPSRTRINDILHTKLEVSFDYARQRMKGKATITVKPYFYPSFYLNLDAVGFDISEVSLVTDETKQPLTYNYDGKNITIKLDRVYRNNEEYKVFIDYVAKPNDVKAKGSSAINDAKGLYFINPQGKDKNKPIQIWTQGETQASSCWFPTIDSPNERMTQEIYMTVDSQYVTLSNGLLISSKDNGNGTRTDYWKQSLPSAPYLSMMTVGKFAVIKDRWRKIDVNYYVEPEYAPYAKMIFGNTPEMLEFFSRKLGVDYPWEKFHQIVVRDYISGAMENTSAVLHGEFLQKTERELIDETNEEVISHELFHQWFGDLVTCESWANLPLNESFATYGEYLWNEKKYGPEEADYSLNKDLTVYLMQSKNKNVDLIRYYHEDKEEMFDAFSYQKGGRVLHMLRKYVGDEAFFEALKLYLNKHKFKAVEIHDLRLVFEEVTGEDLNWFFNQWFLNHGHPQLEVNYVYNDTTKKETITVRQIQDLTQNPLFKLPVDVEFYTKGKTEKHRIMITKESQEFTFELSDKPEMVNFDSDKMLLCTKKENKTLDEWSYQFENGPLYMDRFEALSNLIALPDTDIVISKVIQEALKDKFWHIRQYAAKNLGKALVHNASAFRQRLIKIAKDDEKSSVRAAAIETLSKEFTGNDLNTLYKELLNDPSYMVIGAALEAYGKKQPTEALKLAKDLEKEKNSEVIKSIAGLYIEKGGDEQNPFFLESMEKMKGGNLYMFLQSYGKFLVARSDKTIMESLPALENIARKNNNWYIRLSAVQILGEINLKYEKEESAAKEKFNASTKEGKSPEEITKLGNELSESTKKREAVSKMLSDIKKSEKDSNLIKIYGTKS